MNLKLETEFSKAEMLKEVDALKRQIEDMRPLPSDVEGKVMQKLRLDWNYHSNAIEGNRLSYGETVAFLMEGITAKGKPLKDHLDIRGHNEAINFLLSIVKEPRPISEADIRNLHQMILVEPYEVKAQTADGLPTTKRINLGEYKTSANHVRTATGETHYYATPEETPAKMQELMEWYYEVSQNTAIHPVIFASLFHHKFVAIHPFDDGNGRLSRILMNLILMQKGFPPVVIRNDDRQNYYSLLSRADIGESWPFVEYIVDLLKSSLQLYLKAAKGDNIDEDKDIDKEIALFKIELENTINVKEQRSNTLIDGILVNVSNSLFKKLINKAGQFNDFFFSNSYHLSLSSNEHFIYQFESLDEYLNTTTVSKKHAILNSLKTAGLLFYFNKFKNVENDFNIELLIAISFEDYHYKFFDANKELVLIKQYHEMLSVSDEQRIIKCFIHDIKSLISENLKSLKS